MPAIYTLKGVVYAAPWCSGLARQPVTLEIRGSNPLGVANTLSQTNIVTI